LLSLVYFFKGFAEDEKENVAKFRIEVIKEKGNKDGDKWKGTK